MQKIKIILKISYLKVLIRYCTLHFTVALFRWQNNKTNKIAFQINLSSNACLEVVPIQNKLFIREKSEPANIY